jgi:hypothetical protein
MFQIAIFSQFLKDPSTMLVFILFAMASMPLTFATAFFNVALSGKCHIEKSSCKGESH